MVTPRSSSLSVLIGSAVLSLASAACSSGADESDYMLLRVAYAGIEKSASCYEDSEVPTAVKDDATSFYAGGTLVVFRGPDEAYYLESETTALKGSRDGDILTFTAKSVDVEYVNGDPGKSILDADHDGLEDNSKDGMIDADKDGLDDYQDAEVDTDGDGQDDRYEDEDVDVNKDRLDDRYTMIEPPTDGDKVTVTTKSTVTITISDSDITGKGETSSQSTCSGATCPEELPSCKTSVTFVGTIVEDASVEHQI